MSEINIKLCFFPSQLCEITLLPSSNTKWQISYWEANFSESESGLMASTSDPFQFQGECPVFIKAIVIITIEVNSSLLSVCVSPLIGFPGIW